MLPCSECSLESILLHSWWDRVQGTLVNTVHRLIIIIITGTCSLPPVPPPPLSFCCQILSMIEEAAGTRMYESKRTSAQRTIEKKDSKLREIETVSVETQ